VNDSDRSQARSTGRQASLRGSALALALVLTVAGVLRVGVASEGRGRPEPTDFDPVPSAGCGSSGESDASPGVERIDLMSGGQRRWYLREVPPAHDGHDPVPVVVDLHGYGEGAEGHAQSTQLGEFGAVEGFVTVTPQGQGQMEAWDTAPGSADVTFVEDLLDQVEGALCIDTVRVFVTGSSNGAMLASTLACVASDRIAAVAAVAGVTVVEDCEPERPVPIVAVHGTDDPMIPYGGGLNPAIARLPLPGSSRTIGDLRVDRDLSIPDVMRWWAEREGCATHPARDRVSSDTVLLRYSCPGWTAVDLFRIDGGGHTWPGRDVGPSPTAPRPGPRTPIVANEVIWHFLESHPLSITPSWNTLSP
jgi:polyhydroxybutyrate depolymerase